MNQSRAMITYLFHSGFAVETATCLVIFDYYQPFSPGGKGLSAGTVSRKLLQTKSRVYVFASHNHPDHFDPVILEWADLSPVNYILSSDIPLKRALPRCHRLAPDETFTDATLKVQAFGSTDQGVSFLVETGGLTIFHAGDLNWWQWDEDTPEDQAKAVADFKAEVAKIAGHPIDIAFFPVDRRLKQFYACGAEYFAAQLQPKLLIPMHFGKDFEATKAFAAHMRGRTVPTVEITGKGQEIVF